MGLLRRRRCDGRQHQWSGWTEHGKYSTDQWTVWSRSCKCGAIQRYRPHTGEVTIWSPDGLDSGLLDRGMTRRIFEELDG